MPADMDSVESDRQAMLNGSPWPTGICPRYLGSPATSRTGPCPHPRDKLHWEELFANRWASISQGLTRRPGRGQNPFLCLSGIFEFSTKKILIILSIDTSGRTKKFPPAICLKENLWRPQNPLYPPLCDIPSGCCSFTGPWTVTRSSLRMLRRVAAFCRPLRPVVLLVSFPRSRSPPPLWGRVLTRIGPRDF